MMAHMLRDSLIAAIRTGVAALVGLGIGWLVSKGVSLPEDASTQLTAVLMILSTALYNWVVIQLEQRVHPYFGVLLGVPRAPSYDPQPLAVQSLLGKSSGAEDEKPYPPLADNVDSEGAQAVDGTGRQDD